MKRKFVSIVMVVLLIAIALVGITACTKDEESILVGVWISVAEDNDDSTDYYATITSTDNPNILRYQSYEIDKVTSLFKKNYYHNIYFSENEYKMSKELTNVIDYTITILDDNTIFIKYIYGTQMEYTFRRTTMTLDEFKVQYGKKAE